MQIELVKTPTPFDFKMLWSKMRKNANTSKLISKNITNSFGWNKPIDVYKSLENLKIHLPLNRKKWKNGESNKKKWTLQYTGEKGEKNAWIIMVRAYTLIQRWEEKEKQAIEKCGKAPATVGFPALKTSFCSNFLLAFNRF